MASLALTRKKKDIVDLIEIDDENYDVDRPLTEHFQSSCTIDLSISKSPPFTPASNNSLVACEDINLPPELDVDCIHGSKLGTCQSILMDDEGCKSSFSAYTTTRDFKYQTPLAFTSRIDPIRLYDQFGYNKWDPPSISCSSVGNFGNFSTPMEREPYVRKNVKVNYIDGSDDKKWSKKDFPWTKKLEK
ncbi:hypothetical protein L2E82_43753 [Cichorium intybus]|uniref:Uncharacterized protein n=1 Tax=Cichorium intybus TaxID=13427 RepID=A0ACB8ZP15_CICIN|nr:hypothetical protein L2E82_43753 [Cichorium intybus]